MIMVSCSCAVDLVRVLVHLDLVFGCEGMLF